MSPAGPRIPLSLPVIQTREKAERASVAAVLLCAILLCGALRAQSQEQPAPKSKVAPYALIYGNVFGVTGAVFPGAKVEIRRASERKPRWKTESDARGEFAVRLPAGAARYVLTLRARGFSEEMRTVEIVNDERVDLHFRLQPRVEGRQ